ncbi:MAG: fused MFS/spermidine synthase [Planctomycetes bacterium]|nr:fused MFS/spermidine synthase [Planctomycetota bacterium]
MQKSPPEPWLAVVFGASGFCALVYQVVWQRALFSIFGINIEAVAVVVTAFMLGLGAGSLLGGRLSRAGPRAALGRFAAIEAAIGGFGLVSLPLFATVGRATLFWSPPAIAAVTLGLLLVPTLLMGATLPLLVHYLVCRSRDVGGSLGTLYFVNALGSALASILAAVFLLGFLGRQGSVVLAAAGNLGVALFVAWRARRAREAAEA